VVRKPGEEIGAGGPRDQQVANARRVSRGRLSWGASPAARRQGSVVPCAVEGSWSHGNCPGFVLGLQSLGSAEHSCEDSSVDSLFQSRETYWLTRFVILRLLGIVYVVAFLVAVNQLIPLIGSDGITPAGAFLPRFEQSIGSPAEAFFRLPSLFWFNCSDTMLRVIPWIGLILSCAVAAGFANSIILAVLWVLYLSIVHVGQDWYGFGWEIQLTETGFLAIFLVPLLDARPFPARPPPYVVIVLFRWLIVRIMLGAALINLRGDTSWTDLTALNYFFEPAHGLLPLSAAWGARLRRVVHLLR